MSGWLINDCLTCIPNTKTFWHDLLEWNEELVDKCNGYTDYSILPSYIEQQLVTFTPDYIIRNATFFRRLNTNIKTISLLQDSYGDYRRVDQINVCNNSFTVFNSNYVASLYKNDITGPQRIIPLGVDFEFFIPMNKRDLRKKWGFDENAPTILYVGSSMNYPKGFNHIIDLIHNTDYNFCLVMKDDFNLEHPRVKVFNKITHDVLVEIHNCCDVALCTSLIETQHLGGLEAAASGLPLVVTNVGMYHNLPSGEWGVNADIANFKHAIEHVIMNKHNYDSRQYFLQKGYDKPSCAASWKKLIYEVVNGIY